MATNKAELVLSATDRTKAAFAGVGQSLDRLNGKVSSFAGAAGKLGAVGIAVSAAFAALENVKAIQILDQLDDLAEKTGISVEKLSELRFAGESVGTPIGALSTGISKLGKTMAEAAGGGKEAVAAFKTIGVEFKNADGTLRSTDAVLKNIADRFAGWGDGPEKGALALKFFSKTGEDMIPLLNQGSQGIARLREEAGKLGAIYSGDLAKDAAAFNDNLLKIKISAEAAAVAISGPLITALGRMSTELLEGRKTFGSYFNAFVEIGVKSSPFDSWSDGAKKAEGDVKRLADEIAKLESGRRGMTESVGGAAFVSPGGTARSASRLAAAKAELSSAQKRKTYFDSLIYNSTSAEARRLESAYYGGTTQAPVTPSGGGAKEPADDPTKKFLDNRLKELQRAADAERELLTSRNEFLNLYNEQGLISIADYFGQRQNILDEATKKQIAAYDEQIKALQDYQAKTPKATDRAEAEGKIAELVEKRAKLEREAGTQAIKSGIERQKAEKEYRDDIDEVNAKLLEMQGRLGEAAAIRFDKQFDGLTRAFSANNNANAMAMVRNLKDIQVAQAEINKLQQGFSVVQGDLQLAEDRITLARERGTIGEMQSLKASGEARQKALAQLREQLALYEQIDAAARTPEQQQSVDRMKLQVEQLESQLDPLADRFNTMISDAAGSALSSVFRGDKSPKQAAKAFFSSVTNGIGDMVAKDLSSSFFKNVLGGGESGNGIGGFLSSLFGGGGESAGGLLGGLAGKGGAKLGSSPMNAMYVRSADPIMGGGASGGGLLDSLFSSSSGWLTGVANVMPGDSLDNLMELTGGFGTMPSFDVGTDFVPEDMIAKIHKGERIVPAAQNKPGYGGMSQTNQFYLEGKVDRSTQEQITRRLRRQQLQSAARFD